MEVHFALTLKESSTTSQPDAGAETRRGSCRTSSAGYIDELARARAMTDGRYEDLKAGQVKPIDGEEFFESLRCREDQLLNGRSPL